ncbi:hypothetical protein HOK00_08415 [bacterium]|jgi:hypothetical protein|nr:hypothetical protein [bacterium]
MKDINLLNSFKILEESINLKIKVDFSFENKDYIQDNDKKIKISHLKTMFDSILLDNLSEEQNNISFLLYLNQLKNINYKFAAITFSIFEEVQTAKKKSLNNWQKKKLNVDLSMINKYNKNKKIGINFE